MDESKRERINEIVSMIDAESSSKVEQKECSVLLWISIFSPVVLPLIGFALGSTVLNQDDWLGMSIIVPILIGLLLGIIVSFTSMIVAHNMDIRHKGVTLITGVPSALIILYILKELLGELLG